uniref:Uncharacterized protein n=1 Tax=Rhizophagus irregularis (strain DAOM 181602 / DAOM 197198 / MUCL 43194) TaxID=747089 RepID=U9V3S3_RHIID
MSEQKFDKTQNEINIFNEEVINNENDEIELFHSNQKAAENGDKEAQFNLETKMGITPSKEKFIALEGYAKKSDEERTDILKNAGMEPTQIDQDLANFLGVEDIKFGCFMRGIIMICIDENNTERNKEFGRYIEEYKNLHNATLEQKHFEMNEQIRIMDENWKLKEEYYFKHTSMKKHQIITELGTVDQDDKEKMKKCKEMVDNHLETTGSASSDELPWEKETNSSTCSDEFNQNENFAKRYQIYNKSSHPTKVNTPHSTNNNSQMQERTEYGNSQYSRNQSITMAITADHDMGENSIKSKESMHKPKTANDLKYFAGLFTHQMKGTQAQDDKMITEFLNNNKLLEFHVNTLGRTIKNGNEYTYVGFFTETAKNKFLEDTRISEAIGKFRNLEWLNKIDTTILISVTGIEKSMNIEDNSHQSSDKQVQDIGISHPTGIEEHTE